MSSSVRDYGSIYSIKNFTLNDIAPKYFEMDDISLLNVGLFGYVNEVMANSNEDLFNTVSTYSQEIFPHKAQIPENIYSYAAFYEVDTLFATPAELQTLLVVKEDDIIQYGSVNGDKYEFVIDSAMTIEIEGIPFMCDYDIIIDCKPHQGDYILSARYNIDHNNSISTIKVPYITSKRIIFHGQKYVALSIWVRQVEREIIETSIITNDKINLPSVIFNYSGSIANFEVFYRENQNDAWTQLKKKLVGATPTREPFCFYRLKSEDEIELTFSPKESYFQPAFNSEIKIVVTTTLGEDGMFPYYKGSNISVIPQSETLSYNNNLIMYAIPQSDCVGGTSGSTLEEIRDLVHERRSTLSVYTNENDLQMYFNNLKHRYGTDILFIKKRDDIFERLFSSFVLLKDAESNFYNTNTVDMYLSQTDFDTIYDQTDRYMIKPGTLFTYTDANSFEVQKISGKLSDPDIKSREEEFLYTNPFLMMVSGNVVGFYLNSINNKYVLDYSYVNNDSITQFICNNVEIHRNAALGDDIYSMSVYISAASELPGPIVDSSGGYLGTLKVKGVLHDAGAEVALLDFNFIEYDESTQYYRFDAELQTDDYVTLNNKMRFKNVTGISDGEAKDVLVPMYDSVFAIYTFYKYEEVERNVNHHLSHIPDIASYTLTNKYTTSNDTNVDFITPMSLMRSTITYEPLNTQELATKVSTGNYKTDISDYRMKLTFVPLVDAKTLNNRETFYHFMETMFVHNIQLENIIDKVLNNHGIDMKFYNTFGKSKNFTVGEEDKILDKVNCSIYFKIFPNLNADVDLESSVKIFIKNYIEQINEKGTNAIYISNLIQQLQNNFKDIKYLKFIKINNYPSNIQVIENKSVDINSLTRLEKQRYVPEYLTLREEDVKIDIIYD